MIGYPFSKDALPLGFGCAWLKGGRRTAHSLKLIETAYDVGIRYFDVARMYMSGEAEGVLGNFIPQHRNEIILTSKAGIVPPDPMGLWKHRAARLSHILLRTAKPSGGGYRYGMFDPASLKQSLETSLRELRTDHLDGLLLHEIDEPELVDGTVITLLSELRNSGKINFYGTASTGPQTKRLIKNYGQLMSIVQTANTIFEDNISQLNNHGNFLTITHSVLAGALEQMVRSLSGNSQLRKQWVNLTGLDPDNREATAELLLAEALDTNKKGLVLFSTRSPARIAAAAHVARDKPYSPEQIEGLRKIASSLKADNSSFVSR